VDSTFPDGAQACRIAILEAEVVICQPPIGNDCSWELGYAAGLGKKIYVIGSLDPRDWMTKIDVEFIEESVIDAIAPSMLAEVISAAD
jgi:hypothetical protein